MICRLSINVRCKVPALVAISCVVARWSYDVSASHNSFFSFPAFSFPPRLPEKNLRTPGEKSLRPTLLPGILRPASTSYWNLKYRVVFCYSRHIRWHCSELYFSMHSHSSHPGASECNHTRTNRILFHLYTCTSTVRKKLQCVRMTPDRIATKIDDDKRHTATPINVFF